MEKGSGAVSTTAPYSDPEITTAQPTSPPYYQPAPIIRKTVPASLPYADVTESAPHPQQAQRAAVQQAPQQPQLPQATFMAQDPAAVNSLLQANAVPLGLLARW